MGEGTEFIFWCLAIGGTIVFTLKLAMLFMGLDSDSDGDLTFGDDADISNAANAINLLSLQSIACLIMGTGWMGLFAYTRLELGPWFSWNMGIAFGLALVYFSGKLMQQALRLESSGTLNLKRARGQEGTVYLNIPEGGEGQIQVVVQGRLITASARSDRHAIPTGTKVKVESVDSSGTLVVSRA